MMANNLISMRQEENFEKAEKMSLLLSGMVTQLEYLQRLGNGELTEKIDKKIGSKMKGVYTALSFFLIIGSGIIGYSAKRVIDMPSEMDNTYLQKLNYYQIEKDEHTYILRAFKDPKSADNIIDDINDHMIDQLGFKFTTRSGSIRK